MYLYTKIVDGKITIHDYKIVDNDLYIIFGDYEITFLLILDKNTFDVKLKNKFKAKCGTIYDDKILILDSKSIKTYILKYMLPDYKYIPNKKIKNEYNNLDDLFNITISNLIKPNYNINESKYVIEEISYINGGYGNDEYEIFVINNNNYIITLNGYNINIFIDNIMYNNIIDINGPLYNNLYYNNESIIYLTRYYYHVFDLKTETFSKNLTDNLLSSKDYYKVSNTSLVYYIDGIKKLYDFMKNESITIHEFSNDLDVSNFALHYSNQINENSFIINNIIVTVSDRIFLSDLLNNDEYVSLNNFQVSKSLLTERSGLFKHLLVDMDYDDLELKNDIYEYIEIYLDYVINNNIDTYTIDKLIEICIYLDDVDTYHILYILAHIISLNEISPKLICEYLIILYNNNNENAFYVALNNFINNIDLDELNEYIDKKSDIYKLILNYSFKKSSNYSYEKSYYIF